MAVLDETHDPDRRAWLASAAEPGTDFPVQNLPFGVFRKRGAGAAGRGGVAIGDRILDVAAIASLLEPAARRAAEACADPTLNRLMAMGDEAAVPLRLGLSRLLSDPARRGDVEPHLTPMAEAELLLPAAIGDYTDFYASVFHATNVGALFRPDNPLLPNYKWVPIGYHGRASSIRPSGTAVRRPWGQIKKPDAEAPVFQPSAGLDYEAELGIYLGTPTALGEPVPVGEAARHVFGVCLLNDWSARDIQAWEYQPLGPFLAKNFGSTVSPWIVTRQALAPFRVPAFARPPGDPAPLPYLDDAGDQAEGGCDIGIEVAIRSAEMRRLGLPAQVLSRGSFADAYWTMAQMVAHHASNGCDLRPGDLFGSGTLSGPSADSLGSLLEITRRGAEPVRLASGETRGFLADGDEVVMTGRCVRDGFTPIGLGVCAAEVLPAHP